MADDIFVGNFYPSKELRRWLVQACAKKGRLEMASAAIVVGPVGVGKTFGVMKLCEELGKKVYVIDSQNTENFKDTQDRINKLTNANVAEQFRASKKEDAVVLIDEVETLLTMDRSYLHLLQKMLEGGKNQHIPIVVTVQNSEKKKVLELFERSTVIELGVPNDADILLFLRRTAPDAPVETLADICDTCAGNISMALQMLTMESHGAQQQQPQPQPQHPPTNRQGLDKISTLADVFVHASPKMARYVFTEDPWLHPLRFHENMVYEWSERKGLNAKKQQVYLDILAGICTWDLMMSHFKGGDLQIPIEFVSHLVVHLKQLERKKSAKPPTDAFTKIFSNLSLEKKNQIAVHENGMAMMGSYFNGVGEAIMKTKNKGRKPKTFLAKV